MTKASFNESETFLLEHWLESRQLELAMVQVREKYAAIADRLKEVVTGRNTKLDYLKAAVTQFWDEGILAIGRKKWPMNSNDWPAGYYIENLRLELLADETEPGPLFSIWLEPAKKKSMDIKGATQKIRREAERLLPKKILNRCAFDGGDDYPLCYSLPNTHEELMKMLVQGDSKEFIDCLASHIDTFAQFTPVLDEILIKKK